MQLKYSLDYNIMPDYRVNLMGFVNYLLDHAYGRPLLGVENNHFYVDIPITLIAKELKLDVKRGVFSSKKADYPSGVNFSNVVKKYYIRETSEVVKIRTLVITQEYLLIRPSKVIIDTPNITGEWLEGLSTFEELIVFSHPIYSQLIQKKIIKPIKPPRYYLKKSS
jgi:hypothetical protein